MVETLSDWSRDLSDILAKGRTSPNITDTVCVDQYRIKACASATWLKVEDRNGSRTATGFSDAAIMCGLIALIADFNNRPVHDWTAENIQHMLNETRIDRFVSASRASGLRGIIDKVTKQ